MPAEPVAAQIVSAEHLNIVYPARHGEVTALKDFSLAIAPGEIVGLIGEGGCGKSTAALAMLGLLRPPARAVAGRVMLGGQDLLRLPHEALRALRGREVGLIVQNPRAALNPMLPIGWQIATVFRAHSDATAEAARQHAVAMLRMVGINDPERRAAAYPHEISGGMAQRVLIAMALSSKPKLLVADEPTSGLDVTIQAQFLDQLWHATRAVGSAVLLVTQDLGIIANYCDRVLVMQAGAVVEEAPAARFFAGPAHDYSRSILLLRETQTETDRRAMAAPRAAPAAAVPLLEVRGLSKRFPLRDRNGFVHAVSDVTLRIDAGSTLGLVGESGSGKTTVGRCLLGLEIADAGELLYRGAKLGLLDAGVPRARRLDLRAKLQLVFQDPYDTLDPRWTVRDLLGEPLRLHARLRGAALERRIAELTDLVGLDRAVLATRPRALSAGQQQRVGIARALAPGPELIVLDEPTSALAPAARAAAIRLLHGLQQRLGVAYLFISHDLATVRHLSRQVAVMYLSQIVEFGDRDQIFAAPRHPYTKALMAAHLDTDPAHRRPEHPPAFRLEGEIPSPIDLPRGCFLAGRCPVELPRCRSERQELRPLADGRLVRCWRAGEDPMPGCAAADAVGAKPVGAEPKDAEAVKERI
jgi:oligopeptide/dipeptide ABC transporter ATP-binding protein